MFVQRLPHASIGATQNTQARVHKTLAAPNVVCCFMALLLPASNESLFLVRLSDARLLKLCRPAVIIIRVQRVLLESRQQLLTKGYFTPGKRFLRWCKPCESATVFSPAESNYE